MSHSVTLDPGGGAERTIDADRIMSLDPVKTHTGLSDFQISTTYDLSLEDYAGDEIHIEDGSTFIFRGILLTVENNQRDHACTLSGYGIGYELTRDQTTKTFNNALVSDAISTVWGETSFSATVHPPSVTETTTDEQAQEANTTSEFQNVVSIDDTDPLEITGDTVTTLQSCFTTWDVAGSTPSDENGVAFNLADDDATGGESVVLTDAGDWVEYQFTGEYDIPAENFVFATRGRAEGSDPPRIEFSLDGQVIGAYEIGGASMAWRNQDGGAADEAPDTTPTTDVGAGVHTVRIEAVTSGTDSWVVGTIAPLDNRFDYDFDNTLDANEGHLDGPELYPDDFQKAFEVASVPWSINEATATTTWDDTTGNQRIGLRLDGGTWFDSDNTTSTTETFGSEKGSGVQFRARFDRHGTQNTTPKTGIEGQTLQSMEIEIDGDDLPVINQAEISGDYLNILQNLHERGRVRFWIDHDPDAKTATSAERGEVTQTLDATVLDRTRSVDLRNYYNHVTVRGQTVDGSRITATVSDSTEISTFGKEHFDVDDAEVTTEVAAEVKARQLLVESLKERETAGEITIVPENLAAGPSYTVEWSDGTTSTAPSEEITYSVAAGDLQGVVSLQVNPVGIGRVVPGLRGGVRNAKRGF